MSAITKIIPTKFSPEPGFAIALHGTEEKPELANDAFILLRFVLPPEDEFARRGIPESVLHD